MMKIYHNTRCSKSRCTLEIIKEKTSDFEIVNYLVTPPSKEELTALIELLGITPYELIRKGEAVFKELYKGKELSDAQWVDAMLSHPKLIERPIVVNNGKAIIGRPPEKVLDII
jgi:arsenate reductase